MLNQLILTTLLGVFGFFQSSFAITIINLMDFPKTIKIEEAYRPAPDVPGDLAAPISLGFSAKKIKIPAHSSKIIPLNTAAPILLITLIHKEKKGKKIITNEWTSCYEPYDFQDQQEDYFTDDWGFVIHKPIVTKSSPFFDSYHQNLENDKRQGFGIKCLHPLLLPKVTSLIDLPEDLILHFDGNTPIKLTIH